MLRCVLALHVVAALAAGSVEKAADQVMRKTILPAFDRVLTDTKARSVGRDDAPSAIDEISDQFGLHIRTCSKRMQKKACDRLRKGLDAKYAEDQIFQESVAAMLASSGKPGIDALCKVFRRSSKSEEVRLLVAEALGKSRERCGLEAVRSLLLHEKSTTVLAALVRACGEYEGEGVEVKKATMSQLIRVYRNLAKKAAHKPAGAPELKRYIVVKPALDDSLSSLSGGQHFKTARDWEVWLRTRGFRPAKRPSRQP